MKDDFDNVYDLIEHAIEYAFEGKMQLKFYEFLKYRKTTKAEIDAFLHSSTAKELADEVLELKEYIKGGRDSNHQQLREAYGHIPKPQEDEKKDLNNDKPLEINRGVELLLRNRRKKPDKPKTFQVKFGKLIALWNREIVFHFNVYLDIRKT
jgi:hypothetical protein